VILMEGRRVAGEEELKEKAQAVALELVNRNRETAS
jgi:hypothetical protein